MTAITRALLILAAKDKFAKALLELCACDNEPVQWQPTVFAAVLSRDVGDDAVCDQEKLDILQHFTAHAVKSIAAFSTPVAAVGIEVTSQEGSNNCGRRAVDS